MIFDEVYLLDISEEEFVTASKINAYPETKKAQRIFVIPACLLIGLTIMRHVSYGLPIKDVVTDIAFYASLIAILVAYGKWISPMRFTRYFRSNPKVYRDISMSFTEETFDVTSSMNASSIPWASFLKWTVTDAAILLFRNKDSFYVVPTRIFQADESLNEVTDFLTKAIGDPQR